MSNYYHDLIKNTALKDKVSLQACMHFILLQTNLLFNCEHVGRHCQQHF